MHNEDDVWWRADIRDYSILDNDDDSLNNVTSIELTSFKVLSTISSGVVIEVPGVFSEKVFILGNASEQFAAPTKDLALSDLLRRIHVHKKELQVQIKNDDKYIFIVNSILGEPEATNSRIH